MNYNSKEECIEFTHALCKWMKLNNREPNLNSADKTEQNHAKFLIEMRNRKKN